MSDRPILFSPPMIRALLDGRKSQTRRVIKPQPIVEPNGAWRWEGRHGGFVGAMGMHVDEGFPESAKAFSRFQPGDRLIPAMSIPSLDRRYCADLFGNIWSRAKGEWRKLKASPTSRGYLAVTPALKGKYQTRYVHHLVCEAFYGPAPEGMQQVRHLDGDHLNNAPHNLDWGTQEQNWQDRAAHGGGMGEAHHGSKLTLEDVAAIRSSNEPQRALAARYGVSQSTIWAARSGECWKEGRQPAAPNLARWTEPATLIVIGVRVQRLQDISEKDARAEGFPITWDGKPYDPPSPEADSWQGYGCASMCLYWNELNAKRGFGWEANPWVVAVSFTVHRCNIDQMEAA